MKSLTYLLNFGFTLLILLALMTSLVVLTSCSNTYDLIPGSAGSQGAAGSAGKDGIDGKDGSGLTAVFEQIEESNCATLSIISEDEEVSSMTLCSIQGSAGSDGQDGRDGEDGQDGEQGEQGPAGEAGISTGSVSVIVPTSSCQHLTGSYYIKNSTVYYENDFNHCDGNNDKVSLNSSGDSLWLNSARTMLLIKDTFGSIGIIDFTGGI